jgi:hypothetical protein
MLPAGLLDEDDDELDEDDGRVLDDEDEELEELSLVELAVVVELAVLVSSSLPSSRKRATPIAARTTTPATMSAIRVFLLPFGC